MVKKSSFILYGIFLLLFTFSVGLIAAPSAATGIHTFADSSVLADGQWVRIAVDQTGIFQITDSEMRKMGFSDPSKVGVYGFGGAMIPESLSVPHHDDLTELPVYRDESRKRILFYGQGPVSWEYISWRGFQHRTNPYSTFGCYFLHQKEEAPLALEQSLSGNVGLACEEYDDYLLHEVDEVNIGRTGREMYGESFVYKQAQNFLFQIPGVASDKALLEANFVANILGATGSLSFFINGQQLSEKAVVPMKGEKYLLARNIDIQSNWTPTETSDYKIGVVYKPNSATSKFLYLNYIRLNVKRKLQLYGSYTLFRSIQSVNNISFYYVAKSNNSANLQVWDVTDQSAPFSHELVESGDNTGFVPKEKGLREYVMLKTDGTFPSVTSLGAVSNQNLHALPQTDMVIIVQPKLREQAERLAAYRRVHDSLTVTIVTPQQIYNEFSSGTPDASAYRLFMKMFYDRSHRVGKAPQYLLLFGDGAYDNRGMDSFHWKNSVLENCLLTYQSEPSLSETESYVCDDYFGFLDDNEGGKKDDIGQLTLSSDVLDIGIGRLPVRTVDEAKTLVDKIIAYSDNKVVGKWKNNLCFLGDDGDSYTHMEHADSMVTLMKKAGHGEFIFNKIYLDAYKREMTASGTAYPAAKKTFFDLLQQGTLLVNYSGHGATTSITHEKILTLGEAESLQMKRLPVWVTATCDFSRFDDYSTSAGESLLLNPNGGAIAMFTTTRIVYADQNLRINEELIKNLFIKHDDGTRYRMGDVIKLSKQKLGSQTNKLNFTLLGDPSMTMAYPEYRMHVTSVNGQPIGNQPVQLQALSSVTMKGYVEELGSDAVAKDFSGLIYPTIYDCEETVSSFDNDNTGKKWTFDDRTRRLFSGCDSIRNGEFEFSFVVPKDISYSMKSGLVNLYGCDAANHEAQGFFEGFVLGGTAQELQTDTIAPVIESLYLNAETFRSGDVVNATPYLIARISDNTGINTTGSSIGHDLVATIRSSNGQQRYILNDYYLNDVGSMNSGTVGFIVPELTDGMYELELKVWDVYNNSVASTIAFEVKNAAKPELTNLSLRANPVRETAEFLLTHNRPESVLKVRIQVYTQMGQCVWENEQNGLSEYLNALPISWDLRTSSGERVLPGIYIYRAAISSDGKHYATKSKKMIVLAQ